MAVVEDSPQASQSQWWRISPPSTNSDTTGATIQSPQCGQRTGEAKERIPASVAVQVWSCIVSVSSDRSPRWWLEAHRGEDATVR